VEVGVEVILELLLQVQVEVVMVVDQLQQLQEQLILVEAVGVDLELHHLMLVELVDQVLL
jgi:hypothetical protein